MVPTLKTLIKKAEQVRVEVPWLDTTFSITKTELRHFLRHTPNVKLSYYYDDHYNILYIEEDFNYASLRR